MPENYTIIEHSVAAGGGYGVWMRDRAVRLSNHDTKRGAKAAVKRYEAADARRATYDAMRQRIANQ